MMDNILSKEYVITNGIDFNSLSYEYCSDRMLDRNEEDGGQPFNGLTYELTEDGKLIYYGYYKDGFEEGDKVFFYPNGNIESVAHMKRGLVFGEDVKYFENGKLQSISYSEYGVTLTKKEWNEKGKLIFDKEVPTKSDLENHERGKQWYGRITNMQDE